MASDPQLQHPAIAAAAMDLHHRLGRPVIIMANKWDAVKSKAETQKELRRALDLKFAFLEQAGQQHGFTVEAAATVAQQGLRVSSTGVREALAVADFALAERLLGRPYAIAGRVLHGQKLGRQLNAPTANVQLKRKRVPLSGVYLVSVRLDGRLLPGVANIGVRPSVQSDGFAHLEVHLLDFNGDLYGRRLEVIFHRKLRDEQRFASLEALKTAIDADIAAARAYWLGQPLQ